MPLFLYPFLNTASKTRPFEYLRLTSLGVVGALVKVDDTDVINFLLSTEIIPLCLRTMEMGSELSKTVATFIVQKILLDDVRAVRFKRIVCVCAAVWLCVARAGALRAARTCFFFFAPTPPPPHTSAPSNPHTLPPLKPPHQVGLNYICATAERFFAVGAVLGNMVVLLSEAPSPRLLKVSLCAVCCGCCGCCCVAARCGCVMRARERERA